jgi:hypothetical protein
MPFHSTYNHLMHLADTPSTNDKEEYLERVALQDPVFIKTVQYALSQGWTYNINSLDPHSAPANVTDSDEIFEFLDYLREKGSANNDDKWKLGRLSSSSEEMLYVVNKIVSKDLRCGVQVKTINKIRKGTCHLVPYQRCSSESKIKNIQYPALAQKKADSMFSYCMPFKETDMFLTRGGMYYDVVSNTLRKEVKALVDGKEVLVGEMQVLDTAYHSVLPRKEGNGIINSIIQKGKVTQEEMDRVIYDVWDIIPYDAFIEQIYKVNIIHRFKGLLERKKRIRGDAVDVIPYVFVNSEEEARKFYKTMRKNGYEGAILKNFADYWKFNCSTKQIKLKNQSVAEFEIIGAYCGKKKETEHVLGGIIVKSECGGIISNCGGGFSKKEREDGVDWWMKQVGKIVSIKFEMVTEDKTSRVHKKLSSPQYDEIRHDKIEADTMEYCIDISTGGKK